MRVLVANRGEIAVRLIQALEELEMESVAIHTAKDKLHALCASKSVEIPSATTYMDGAAILEIAKETHCHAIVPGYGFLSESSDFAELCRVEGVSFVGPSPGVLKSLGDKASAKEIARSLGVPILPSAAVQSAADIIDFALQVQYPIMIKALDGGGGKGIRVVRSEEEVENLLQEAMNESPSRQVFVEKAALEGYKHIEIQVIGDRAGNVSTLFERECSLQRNFQKLLEIAPSSLVPSRISPVTEAAKKIAAHVRYVGLGTFEFLVDTNSDEFYFMECNPRIQVEHTITEQISGIDLVHALIKVCLMNASIASLDLPSEPRGSSIQCRINAEDPVSFLPSQGSVTSQSLPSGAGIRVDSILNNTRAGSTTYEATDEYDSLLAKIITTGSTFDLALKKAQYAVSRTQVSGVPSNLLLMMGLLVSSLLHTPQKIDTRTLSQPGMIQDLVISGSHVFKAKSSSLSSSVESPALSQDAMIMHGAPTTAPFKKGDTFTFSLDNAPMHTIHITKILKMDYPKHVSAQISHVTSARPEDTKTGLLTLEKAASGVGIGSARHRKADPKDTNHVALPFSGVLVELLVEPGDVVSEGETVAVFRQGKMELDVRCAFAGSVVEVPDLKEGESVCAGALVAIVSAAADRAKL